MPITDMSFGEPESNKKTHLDIKWKRNAKIYAGKEKLHIFKS